MMSSVSLPDLPESTLLKILSFLIAPELLSLHRVHCRLARLTRDFSLWRHVDFGRKALSRQSLSSFIRFLGPHTRTIILTGYVRKSRLRPKRSQHTSEAFLTSVKRRCTNLQELYLHRCYIDATTINLRVLPATIRKLSLSGSAVINLPQDRFMLRDSPFFLTGRHLPLLEEVVLEDCDTWLFKLDLFLLMGQCPTLQVVRVGDACYVRASDYTWNWEVRESCSTTITIQPRFRAK